MGQSCLLLVLLTIGCKGFQTPMNQRLSQKNDPKEVYFDAAAEPDARSGQAERLQGEMQEEQAARSYNRANRAYIQHDLYETRRLLKQVLKFVPKHKKATSMLAKIEREIATLPEDQRQDSMSAEARIAQQKATVEIRRRMKLAADLIRSRDFTGASEELRLAMRSTNQLPEGLIRACVRYRITSLGQFARRQASSG